GTCKGEREQAAVHADAPGEPQKYSSGTIWGTTDAGHASGRELPPPGAVPKPAAADNLVDPSPPMPRPHAGPSSFVGGLLWSHRPSPCVCARLTGRGPGGCA